MTYIIIVVVVAIIIIIIIIIIISKKNTYLKSMITKIISFSKVQKGNNKYGLFFNK